MKDSVEASVVPHVTGGVRVLLRVEGLAVLMAAAWLYVGLGASWWWFAGLFLLPDVSFLAYLINPKVGAVAYNALHTYLAPAALLVLAVYLAKYADGSRMVMLAAALTWFAHIGFDRMMGYGLKYATAFGHTHLGVVGKQPRQAV
jgi:hypothetical protein